MTDRNPANSFPILNIASEEYYSLEDVFYRIADLEHPCSYEKVACNQCRIFDRHKSWHVNFEPSCKDVWKTRDDFMLHLARRVYLAVAKGMYKLLDKENKNTLPYPTLIAESRAEESQITDWVKSANIHKSDLLIFCADINFHLAFRQRTDFNTATSKPQELISQSLTNLTETHEEKATPPESIQDETSAERKLRIIGRKNELKNQGVRNFLQQVALEEGVTPGRIKQITQDKKSKNGISKY